MVGKLPLSNVMRDALGTYKQTSKRIVPAGRLWPNGEFSLGYSREGEEGDQSSEWMWANEGSYLTGEELDERLAAMYEVLEAASEWWLSAAALVASGLTLSNVWNSHRQPTTTKNGLKGMTGYGTKMLRSACYLLEKRLGRDDCVMVTLTVPTLGRTARRALAQGWGEVVRQLTQYLSRALLKAGRSPVIAGCVEIQTARLERYRQGYLHVHLVCPAHANKGGRWAIDADALRTWWKRCIERVIKTSLPHLPRVETAIVQKSVEGYLGKYLSKGTGAELAAFIGDLGEDAVPGQWWFMSAPMRDAVKAGTKSGKNAGAVLDAVVNYLLEQGTGEGFEYIRHIDCVMHDKPVTVGWVGRLSSELRVEVFAMLDS